MIIVPHLIKAGDNTIGLGKSMSPPKLDCRVWSEQSYQGVIEILEEVRDRDIKTYIEGESPLLPQKLRKRIHDILKAHNK
jgi:hypothetical protein